MPNERGGARMAFSGYTRTPESVTRVHLENKLNRLEKTLQLESDRIKTPPRQQYTPFTFNKLKPYCDVKSAKFLIRLPQLQRQPSGHSSRQTATGLCDPWVNLDMDRNFLPSVHRKSHSGNGFVLKNSEASRGADGRYKEGSTMVPKFPMVNMPTGNLTGEKPLIYSDVPVLRKRILRLRELIAETQAREDYVRTTQDFRRMGLDLDLYHPRNRERMKLTYLAYLQNTPGSRRAIHHCINREHARKESVEHLGCH